MNLFTETTTPACTLGPSCVIISFVRWCLTWCFVISLIDHWALLKAVKLYASKTHHSNHINIQVWYHNDPFELQGKTHVERRRRRRLKIMYMYMYIIITVIAIIILIIIVSGLHNYECITPFSANTFEGDQFWDISTASVSTRLWSFRLSKLSSGMRFGGVQSGSHSRLARKYLTALICTTMQCTVNTSSSGGHKSLSGTRTKISAQMPV